MPHLLIDAVSTENLEPEVAPRLLQFRLAPSFRRCAWYVLGGVILCTGLQIRLWRLGMIPPEALDGRQFAVPAILFSAAFSLLFAAENWRLRLDRNGISRRRFGLWSHWPWQAFHDGSIRVNSLLKRIRYPSRPWWDRELSLAMLTESDRMTLLQLCQLAHVGAPPEPLPEIESFSAIGLWQSAQMTEAGIAWKNKSRSDLILWDDIEVLTVQWQANKGQCFGKVLMQHGTESLQLNAIRFECSMHGRRKYVRVEDLEPIERMLANHLSDGRLRSVQSMFEPRSAEEARYQRGFWTGKMQAAQKLSWGCIILSTALVVAMALFIFMPGFRRMWNDPFMALEWKIITTVCGVLSMIMQPLLLVILPLSFVHKIKQHLQQIEDRWPPKL